MKKTLFSAFILLFAISSYGKSLQDTLTRLENVLAKYYKPENPGVQVTVSRNGEVLYSKAIGMADLERNVSLTTESLIEAGSVSKQFTAAAILLLEQQGKLSVEDDIRKYAPEIPDYGTPIRIFHLLHHTSGLKDWGALASLTGWPRGTKFYSNEDALEIMSRQTSLNNKPGDEYIYSNSNYNLMAIIVQRVSGLSLAEFSKKYLFEPAGMTKTQWRNNPNRIVLNRALAYSKNAGFYETNMPNEYVYGNGGLLTTTDELAKWSSFYLEGKLGGSELLKNQVKTRNLNNGVYNNYAAGLMILRNGINHSGSTAGYRAYLTTFNEQKLTIAILSNTGEHNISAVNKEIIEVFKPSNTLTNIEGEYPLKSEESAGLLGWYKNRKDASGTEITLKNGKLNLDNTALHSVSEKHFLLGPNQIIFDKSSSFIFVTSSKDTTHFEKAEKTDYHFEKLYGEYFSDEMKSSVTIFEKAGKPFIRVKADAVLELYPTYKNAVRISDTGGSLYFDEKSKIVNVSIPRARNVSYKNVNK
jgi:CubicO group peptidase (beta-lactamase class C family)